MERRQGWAYGLTAAILVAAMAFFLLSEAPDAADASPAAAPPPGNDETAPCTAPLEPVSFTHAHSGADETFSFDVRCPREADLSAWFQGATTGSSVSIRVLNPDGGIALETSTSDSGPNVSVGVSGQQSLQSVRATLAAGTWTVEFRGMGGMTGRFTLEPTS